MRFDKSLCIFLPKIKTVVSDYTLCKEFSYHIYQIRFPVTCLIDEGLFFDNGFYFLIESLIEKKKKKRDENVFHSI